MIWGTDESPLSKKLNQTVKCDAAYTARTCIKVLKFVSIVKSRKPNITLIIILNS